MIYDMLENIHNYEGLGRVYAALRFLARTDFSGIPVGRYELEGEDIFYMVQEYTTSSDMAAEAHEKYIDIQCMLEGEELIGVAPFGCQKTLLSAQPDKDVWKYTCHTEPLTLFKGGFMVLYPNDIHRPGVAKGTPAHCRKVVVKVRVE